MALRGPLLEKAILLGVPAAALAAVLAASFVLKGTFSRPPDIVFEGKLTPRGATAPKPAGTTTSSGAVTLAEDTTPPKITATTPAPNATVDTDFTDVVITFNENIDPASLDASTVQVFRSGGDGLFDNGNDVQIVPDAIEPLDATHARVVLPSGLPPDTYRVILRGWPLSASGSTSSATSSTSSTTGTTSSTSSGASSSSTSSSSSTASSTSNSTSNSSTSTSATSSNSTATSGATSSATSSTTTASSTNSATSNSTTTATSNSTTASASSASTASSTTSTGSCADGGVSMPLAAGSSSGSGYFGG